LHQHIEGNQIIMAFVKRADKKSLKASIPVPKVKRSNCTRYWTLALCSFILILIRPDLWFWLIQRAFSYRKQGQGLKPLRYKRHSLSYTSSVQATISDGILYKSSSEYDVYTTTMGDTPAADPGMENKAFLHKEHIQRDATGNDLLVVPLNTVRLVRGCRCARCHARTYVLRSAKALLAVFMLPKCAVK
jgi:hypothetical protein